MSVLFTEQVFTAFLIYSGFFYLSIAKREKSRFFFTLTIVKVNAPP